MRTYLKDARIKLGYTQSDVANHLGISQNYYCDIENYSRQKELKASVAIELSSFLKIPIDNLLKQEHELQNQNMTISTIHAKQRKESK